MWHCCSEWVGGCSACSYHISNCPSGTEDWCTMKVCATSQRLIKHFKGLLSAGWIHRSRKYLTAGLLNLNSTFSIVHFLELMSLFLCMLAQKVESHGINAIIQCLCDVKWKPYLVVKGTGFFSLGQGKTPAKDKTFRYSVYWIYLYFTLLPQICFCHPSLSTTTHPQ